VPACDEPSPRVVRRPRALVVERVVRMRQQSTPSSVSSLDAARQAGRAPQRSRTTSDPCAA